MLFLIIKARGNQDTYSKPILTYLHTYLHIFDVELFMCISYTCMHPHAYYVQMCEWSYVSTFTYACM